MIYEQFNFTSHHRWSTERTTYYTNIGFYRRGILTDIIHLDREDRGRGEVARRQDIKATFCTNMNKRRANL